MLLGMSVANKHHRFLHSKDSEKGLRRRCKSDLTPNPFAASDVYVADKMKIDVNGFNDYGSSLIFGHPQAPTAARLIIEGIEETVMKGGGYMLFTGCAAGDTGAALVLKIG
jgi:hypothetical protein